MACLVSAGQGVHRFARAAWYLYESAGIVRSIYLETTHKRFNLVCGIDIRRSTTTSATVMEWLALDARLEEKKKAKVRRQQRELKRLQKERDARERQQLKLAQRCAEMHAEELLSIAMMHLYAQEEARKELERQREEEMKLFRDVDRARKRAQALGLPLSTAGLAGHDRLVELESRIADKEDALKRAAAAKQRLDALPAKRSALKRFMTQFMVSSLQKKVERAVSEQQCEHLLHLFDPASHVTDNRTAPLLNHESTNGFTPVLASIFSRKLSVLRRLLEIGASPDCETTWGMTPLLASVMTDDVVAVSILLEFRANVQYETAQHVHAVHLAAMKGRTAVLKMLVRSGADVNATTSDTGKSALMFAVIANQLDAVTTLLALGADKDKRDQSGKSAADYAVQLEFGHIASLLSSSVSPASLHAQLLADEEDEAEGRAAASVMRIASQRRALMLETAMRDRNVLRLRQLLEDPMFNANYEDRLGDTPLLVMCRVGSCADVLFCLEKRAIPTLQNRFGTNALMAASYRGQLDMLEQLMHAGVDLRTRDFKGWDCFRHLNTLDHPDVVVLLTKRCRSNARSRPPAFALHEPLASTAMLRRQDVKASESLVESPGTPTEPEVSSTGEIESARDSTAQSSSHDHSDDSDDGSHRDGHSSDASNSDPTDDPIIRKWQTRQRVLKNNRQRRLDFDAERDKILQTAHRSRRNGLVAPLPSDPAGRKKLPLCDNCKRVRARKRCVECDQVLCDKCHARLHELAHRRHHSFEMLEAQVFAGSELKDVVQARENASLMHFVASSQQHVASMRKLLRGDAAHLDDSRSRVHRKDVDPEIERFERSKRLAREKQVMQMPINVPVAAAKHAARGGDGEIFTEPAEIELANLYIVQKKYEKAKALLVQMQQLVTDSLGALHPTALKIAIGLAQVYNVRTAVPLDFAGRYREAVRLTLLVALVNRRLDIRTRASRPCRAHWGCLRASCLQITRTCCLVCLCCSPDWCVTASRCAE